MKIQKKLSAIALAAFALTLYSCEDTYNVGQSLFDNKVEIVVDSAYTISGKSILNPEVRSRTIVQLFGRINVEGFGNLSSDVVTQFISSETIDTTGLDKSSIDSINLVLGMPLGSFVGDSVIPMGLEVYPLTKQLPSPIFSSFDPKGYYDPANCWGSTIYAATTSNLTGVYDKDDDYRYINIRLPLDFAYSMLNQYRESPQTFATPQSFAAWFPGLYIRNSFGSGRMINVANTSIKIYYHRTSKVTGTDRDTTIRYISTYMAVSPEVLTNNNITFTKSQALVDDVNAGKTILAAPIGYDVEFEFPIKKVIEDFKAAGTPMSVVNFLTLSIPAKPIANKYGLTPPPYVLLIKKSEKEKFFSKANLPDDTSSFFATYSSSTGTYDFSSMRPYLMEMLEKDEITPEDTEFILTPVSATFSKSQETINPYLQYYYGATVSSEAKLESVLPYVLAPVMCTLELDKAKIKFTHSLQKI